jgi:hypothetical protein
MRVGEPYQVYVEEVNEKFGWRGRQPRLEPDRDANVQKSLEKV